VKSPQFYRAVFNSNIQLLSAERNEALASNEIPDEVVEFEVLGGRIYSHSQRPPFWRNERRLHVPGTTLGTPPLMLQLPLLDFPLIDNFEVWLESMSVAGEALFGFHVHFYSASRGYVATFPWWDHVERDLIRDDYQFPVADSRNTFYDLEQGWEILIFASNDFVYVLQGDFETTVDEGYYAWFKVNKDLYLAEWQKAITLCKKTFGS
jgi:hypothetical protein